MFQFWMAGDAAQGVGADVAFADVPVAIDAGVVRRARIVEVNRVDVLSLYCVLHSLHQRLKAVFFTNVVAGCEGVRGVETNAEREFGTSAHELLKVFETMADAVALAGSVFEEDFEFAKPHTLARDLQTRRAQPEAVRFTRATRTSGKFSSNPPPPVSPVRPRENSELFSVSRAMRQARPCA